MTSLSNVIKRQRATSNEPLRIESKSLHKPAVEKLEAIDHDHLIQSRYLELERDEQAFRLLQETEAGRLDQLKKETLAKAEKQGYEAGLQQGRIEGKAEFEEVTTRLNSIAAELEQLFEEKWRATEQQLVELAVTVSAHVTTELVRKDEELFANVIHEQISQYFDAESLVINVHPTRLASIQRFESLWRSEETPSFKYRGDASLDETSVRIETPHKGSESDLAYSFERIQAKIEEVLADGAY